MNEQRLTVSQLLSRAGWLVVVMASLGMSAWSLYFVGRAWGCPPPVAALISAAFDGAALVSGDLALRYARSPHGGGFGPRLAVFAFAGVSCVLNSEHAVLVHDPGLARLLFAAPPAVSVTVFELHARYERRAALRAAGRIAAPLPVLSRASWLLFPLRSLRTMRAIVAHRLARIEQEAIGREQAPALSKADVKRVRAWAKGEGLNVNASGPVAQEILAAYTAALASQNGHPRALAGSKP